jgi:hypothetical protein
MSTTTFLGPFLVFDALVSVLAAVVVVGAGVGVVVW